MTAKGASEIEVGTVIADTYEVTALIGQGGMGAVWAANHRRLPGKRVAIKVLLGAASEPQALARFRREAEIASRIGHPNIVEVLDFNALPSGTPYMILEYLQGESLAERLRRVGAMACEPALEIVRQVGSALHAAHRADVVHRDLKPDNIFLCPTDSGGVLADRVKVLDFGISKIRNSQTVQTQESALLGTPQYMSPEQAYGRNKQIDQRTDVWALGAIVYEMVTGEAAFAGESLTQVIVRIIHDPPPSLVGRPGVPERVVKAVGRALEREADRRFPDVASFIEELTGKPLYTLDRAVPPRISAMASAATGAADPAELGVTATQASSPPSLGTQPRGEVIAVPPTHAAAPRGLRAGKLLGIGIGVAGLAVALAVTLTRPGHSTPPLPSAPPTTTAPTTTLPTTTTPTTTPPTPAPPTTTTPTATTPTTATPTTATPTRATPTGAPP
ncbi:MAG: serine/threonine-protein kinase, partial [Polyangia bacterium]